jgi:hypothetical protein
MSTLKIFDSIPASSQTWRRHAAKAKVMNKWIGDCDEMASGSKIGQKQFLLLRVIVQKVSRDNFNPRKFGLGDQIEKARDILGDSESFRSFLDAIKKDEEGGLGYFAPIRKQQHKILYPYSGSEGVTGPTTLDETPINSIAVNFMKAVQNTIPDRKYRWRYSKAQLTAAFPKEMKHGPKRAKEDVRAFTAETDGQLQGARSYGIKLILECKKDKREKCGPHVDMQEAAQIVAWVKGYPSTERQ